LRLQPFDKFTLFLGSVVDPSGYVLASGIIQDPRPAKRGEQQEDCEEKQGQWRYEACSLPFDVAPSQVTWSPQQQWKGPPDLSFDVEDPVQDVVAKCAE
jgi:hypothetical protein